MPTLTVPKIVDQLNSYRARGVPNILAISKYKLKADKLAALEKAFEWYQLNGTLPSVPESTPVDIAPVPEVVDDWELYDLLYTICHVISLTTC
ncbi:hypothetical protein C8F04DRAFT_1251123 [Mycena alexandri]|uniref:Uncharacterized protein n=1 Tax=Mycena alexandri TaxID=1745969 RepID=A0AAD6TBX6_9AGAR|nr:hypothetical protein C8F04DRAFT_1251123 [Mycena alexandri]